MNVLELFNKLNINEKCSVNYEISNITKDTRKINKNSLFFLFDKKYLKEAILKNVSIIITNLEIECNKTTIIKVSNLQKCYSEALRLFYLTYCPFIIGITGTCGKTTTCTLVYRTLKLANKNTLLISSNGIFSYYLGKETEYPTSNTTPDLEVIYSYISTFNYDYIIIEVSSQGISHGRISGIEFDLGVFLNISQDHLDYHLTFSNYLNTKRKLFDQINKSGIALINNNSKYKNYFITPNISNYTFGFLDSDYNIEVVEVHLEKMEIKIEDKCITTTFTGLYNAENISAAYAVTKILKVNVKYLIMVLQQHYEIDGRFNVINYKTNKIIVDFAHTEKEFEVVLKHLYENKINKLYVVAGCGGNRDKDKRPVLGYLCSKYCDYSIITEDNSRTEDVHDIINDIKSGFINENFVVIIDRFDAIKYGISLLLEYDILAILGMGKDKSYLINDEYYSDKMLVNKVLEEV